MIMEETTDKTTQRSLKPDRLKLNEFPHQPSRPGGSVPATIENIDHLLTASNIVARFNSVKKRTELVLTSGEPVPLNQVTSLAILNGINTNWLHEFIDDLAARNTYNPVEEWIRSKPWDGVDRLAALGDTHRQARLRPSRKRFTDIEGRSQRTTFFVKPGSGCPSTDATVSMAERTTSASASNSRNKTEHPFEHGL